MYPIFKLRKLSDEFQFEKSTIVFDENTHQITQCYRIEIHFDENKGVCCWIDSVSMKNIESLKSEKCDNTSQRCSLLKLFHNLPKHRHLYQAIDFSSDLFIYVLPAIVQNISRGCVGNIFEQFNARSRNSDQKPEALFCGPTLSLHDRICPFGAFRILYSTAWPEPLHAFSKHVDTYLEDIDLEIALMHRETRYFFEAVVKEYERFCGEKHRRCRTSREFKRLKNYLKSDEGKR